MKKVFLDDLPRKKYGENERINWKESIGYKIKFIYENIEGEIEIVDYYKKNNKEYLKVKYIKNILEIRTCSVSNCNLGRLLNKTYDNYKYNIGDIIGNKFSEIKILEQIRILDSRQTSKKGYKYECLKCKNKHWIGENKLNKDQGCNVCSGKKVLKGINDLWTTHPHIAKLLKCPNNGYKLNHGSGKSEIFICPNCGYEKEYIIFNIINNKFSCPKCGDGISYPNKIGFNLLEQLGINFEFEYNPDWIKPKRYDFYFILNGKQYILEMDGYWHNNDNKLSGQTAEESQAIDDYKDMKAKENGIEVIRIDCKISDLEYIKNNILTSKLNELFNLNNIDWLKCEEFACSSFVKIACDYWNSGIRNARKIGEIMKICRAVIIKYLKQGTELNLCCYNSKQIMKENILNTIDYKKRKIIQLSLDNIFIKEWESITQANSKTGILNQNIIKCCKGKRNHAGKFKWMYKEDYEKNIEEQNKIA